MLNSELHQIQRKIQEEDEKAEITYDIKEKMDNTLELVYKKVLPDHTEQQKKIKEIQKKALSM